MTREEAINVLNSSLELSYFDITKEALTIAIKALEQPEQKKGQWIDIVVANYKWMIRCNKCGHLRNMISTNGIYPKFCENCGADMRGEKQDG